MRVLITDSVCPILQNKLQIWLFEVHNSATIRINEQLLSFRNRAAAHNHEERRQPPSSKLTSAAGGNNITPLYEIVWPSIHECPLCFSSPLSAAAATASEEISGGSAIAAGEMRNISWDFVAVRSFLRKSFTDGLY